MTDEESRLYEQTRGELAILLDQAGPCREELAAMILEVMAEVDTPDTKQVMIIRTAAADAVGDRGK